MGYVIQNPNAIHLLEQNPDKIYWPKLSENPNAIHLLEQNIDKINWWRLTENPNANHLFKYQYRPGDNWYPRCPIMPISFLGTES